MNYRKLFVVGIFAFFYALLSGCAYLADADDSQRGYVVTPSQSIPTAIPTHITLLVPLQGPLGPSGQAIRNGFFAAYYYAKEQSPNVPNISVVDSSGGNITELYKLAVAQGADFVVGPLTKPDVQAIASLDSLPVTTLALNTLENLPTTHNLFEFGLSPIDEAVQIAEKARQDGHNRVLVIAPNGEWGQSISRTFIQRWQSSGGVVVNDISYSNTTDFNAMIKAALQAKQVKDSPNQNLSRASVVRRQDIDMIFLVAFPQQARQIKPSLLYYYAGDIPVYATSAVYSGTPSPQYDQDLNGIYFIDMPWLLDINNSPRLANLRDRIISLWGRSYDRSSRLYALGIDAYSIASNMSGLSTGIAGASGTLYLGNNNHIVRHLMWAQIVNGVPQPINPQ